jgi:hypothetical protein
VITDRDVLEENKLLVSIWRLLTSRTMLNDHARLGMDHEMFLHMRTLSDMQVHRAVDCTSPLLRFAQPDDVVIRLLDSTVARKHASHIRDDVDSLVADVNYVFLTNRWSASRNSPIQAQCALGLSTTLCAALHDCTVSDLKRAASSDIRLWKVAPHTKFFFHTSLNPTLQQANRTIHAACANAGLVY